MGFQLGVVTVFLVVMTSQHTSSLTTVSVWVNATLNATTAPPSPECPTNYTRCRCKSFPTLHAQPQERTRLRDAAGALFGFPIGLALSVVTFYLYRRCQRSCSQPKKVDPRLQGTWKEYYKGRIFPTIRPKPPMKVL